MALDPVPQPAYPNVPQSPGVPAVPRSASDPPTATPAAAAGDSPSVANQTGNVTAGQWGVFDSGGAAVLIPDTIIAFDFKRDRSVPDYPIEDGGFASYNKVSRPYEPRFTMAKGGTIEDRRTFLAKIEAIAADLNLYTISTPEQTWTNANLVHWNIHRAADKGVSLLTVDLWFREIRVAPAPAFSQTKQVSGQSSTNGGTVAPTAPTAKQTAAQTAAGAN